MMDSIKISMESAMKARAIKNMSRNCKRSKKTKLGCSGVGVSKIFRLTNLIEVEANMINGLGHRVRWGAGLGHFSKTSAIQVEVSNKLSHRLFSREYLLQMTKIVIRHTLPESIVPKQVLIGSQNYEGKMQCKVSPRLLGCL